MRPAVDRLMKGGLKKGRRTVMLHNGITFFMGTILFYLMRYYAKITGYGHLVNQKRV